MRTSCVLPAVVALALSASCGDSGSAPAPGPVVPAEPGGSDPNVSPTTVPGTTPDTGTQEGGAVTVERLDLDPECDALVPARIPAPVTARLASPGGACRAAVTDGTGHVAVEIGIPSPCGERQTLSPAGVPGARFADCHALSAQPDGWLLPWGTIGHGPGTVRLESYAGDGTPRGAVSFGQASSPVSAGRWPFAADPRGGAFLVVNPFLLSADVPCAAAGHRFDATGAEAGAPARVGCSVRAVGVSTQGEALVLGVGDGARQGRSIVHWVRPDGTDAAPPGDEGDSYALLGAASARVELAPLLDGSLAARNEGGWTRRYLPLAPGGEAAPAWLAARGREPFRFTRGSRGYAFFPLAGQASADCRQAVELLAPSGRLCTRITFREDASGCTTGAIDQGWDGTVVQQSGVDSCAYRWWPGLLGE
jgi:hypothetical protein